MLPFLSSAGAAAWADGAAAAAGAAPAPLEMLEIISFTLTPSRALANSAVMILNVKLVTVDISHYNMTRTSRYKEGRPRYRHLFDG